MKWLFVPVFFILASAAFAIANPASVYCVQHGGKLTIVNNKNGQVGICNLEIVADLFSQQLKTKLVLQRKKADSSIEKSANAY